MTWTSAKKSIVKVEDGLVTALKKKGSTIITVKYNGKTVNISVTVK